MPLDIIYTGDTRVLENSAQRLRNLSVIIRESPLLPCRIHYHRRSKDDNGQGRQWSAGKRFPYAVVSFQDNIVPAWRTRHHCNERGRCYACGASSAPFSAAGSCVSVPSFTLSEAGAGSTPGSAAVAGVSSAF